MCTSKLLARVLSHPQPRDLTYPYVTLVTRLAQRRVLKDFGIVGDDGKLKEDTVQDYTKRLKKWCHLTSSSHCLV